MTLPPLQDVPEEDMDLGQLCDTRESISTTASAASSPQTSHSRFSEIDGSCAPDVELIFSVNSNPSALRGCPQPQRSFRMLRSSSLRRASSLSRAQTPKQLLKSVSINSISSSQTIRVHAMGVDSNDSKVPSLWRRVLSLFSYPATAQQVAPRSVEHDCDFGANQVHLNKLLVHSDLLAEHSAYFARRLQRVTDFSDDGLAVLMLDVNPKDVILLRELISFIYTSQLPAELNSRCLIELALLADKYEVEGCLEACIKRLALALQKKPEVQYLVQALHLPNQVRTATKLTSVTSVAISFIKSYLQDLEKAWEEEELRQAFITLPYEVVQLLMESSMLEVASENTALVAVCSWLQHNCTADPEKHQQAAAMLLRSVRFQHLTHSFLSQVASLLPWVTNSRQGYRCLMEALQYSQASSMMKRAMEDAGTCPAARLMPRNASKRKHLKFTTYLALEDLRHAAQIADGEEEVQLITSSRHYFQGCCLRFQLEISPASQVTPSRGRVYGGLYWSLGLHPPHLADCVEGIDDVQIRLVYEVHIGAATAAKGGDTSGRKRAKGGQLVYSNIGKQLVWHRKCLGWPELLGSPEPADWERFANKDGRIVVKVVAFECE